MRPVWGNCWDAAHENLHVIPIDADAQDERYELVILNGHIRDTSCPCRPQVEMFEQANQVIHNDRAVGGGQ